MEPPVRGVLYGYRYLAIQRKLAYSEEAQVRKWRTARKCSNCPFHKSGPGLRLRLSLGPGRWRGILLSLTNGNYFPCHSTVKYDDEGEAIPRTGLVCSGSIEWQRKNNASSTYVRLCELHDKERKAKRNA
jgi:hypothetical protein